ncbi:MAG TPA: NAD(P)H-dependent oxidoreductase [Nitrososphaeraceae archaeon]
MILGIAGSLRINSNSTRALKIVLEDASLKYSAETALIDLREKVLPIFNPSDRSEDNQNVKDVTREVVKADAFILASPDYHGSMSGALKNWLDFYWKEFAGKTFGYIVASHEKGLTVMDQMRTAVRQCYGWSLPYGISIHGDHDFNRSGNVTNESLLSRLEMLARDLMVYSKLLRKQFLDDVNNDEQFSFAKYYS